MQRIDRQIRDEHTERLFKALSPEAIRARAEEMRRAGDLSGTIAALEEMAADPIQPSSTFTTKALTPGYFAAAWRTLASAEAEGEATQEMIAKATDQLHTQQYTVMLQDIEIGDTAAARDHLRQLVATGAFPSPVEAAKVEFALNNGQALAKAQPELSRNPVLAEIVLADAWGAIPTAAHQKS